MTLPIYTLWSVSIAATLFSLVLIISLIAGVIIYSRLMNVLQKLEMMSETGLETSRTLQAFVERSTNQFTTFVETFVTLKGAKEAVSHITEVISHMRDNKKKGKDNDHGKSE